MPHKTNKHQKKERPILVEIANCKLKLYPSVILEILANKNLDITTYEKLLLDKKIKFIKENITIDDLSHYHLHLSKA